MTTRVYEGMFILDSNRYARDPSGITGQLVRLVEQLGGEVLASRLWSEQKLAYPISGHRKGTYWLAYFRMNSSKQKELLRECRLNETILRNLILKVDDRLVETLVQHATVGGPHVSRASEVEGVLTGRGEAKRPAGELVDVIGPLDDEPPIELQDED